MALELSCTRAEADHKQIARCQETLKAKANTINIISKILALTGNQTRLKILFLLKEEKELCPCDFADILEMSVPAISQHLRKLKDADIVVSRREGQTLFYSLEAKYMEVLNPIFLNIHKKVKAA